MDQCRLPRSLRISRGLGATSNAYIFVANHDRSLAGVRAAFDASYASYQEMLCLIETLSDVALTEDSHPGWIDGNAAYHYDEHARMFHDWLACKHWQPTQTQYQSYRFLIARTCKRRV